MYAGAELATAVLGAFGVGAFISRWLGAWFALRASPRAVVSLGLAATGTALILLLLAEGPVAKVGAAALVGSAFEIHEPITYEAFARACSGVERRRAYSLLGTVVLAAGAFAGLMATVLLPLGIRWLIIADAATCLAAAVVSWSRLPREQQAPRPERPGIQWKPPARLVRLTVAGTLFSLGYLAVIMFVPLSLLERGAATWVPGVILMLAAVASPLLSAARDRLPLHPNRSHGLEIGLVISAVLAAGMAIPTGVVSLSGVYVLWVAVSSRLLGGWSARVADQAPPPDRTFWFAFHGSSWAIAQPAVPGLAALLSPLLPKTSDAALLIAPLALALSAVLLLPIAVPQEDQASR
ncbi:MFS transporter [Streptomyces mirabilis]